MNQKERWWGTPAHWVARRPRSRQYTRAFVVVGVLLFVVGAQVERAVKTGYDVEWTRQGSDRMRLPPGGWDLLLVASGPAAIMLLLAAANVWHTRERQTTLRGKPDVVKTPLVLGCVALGLAVIAAVFRWRAVNGHGADELTIATVSSIAALGAVTGYALVIGNVLYLEHGGILRVFRGVFRRQRVSIAMVVALTLLLLFLGDTGGQSVDSIRSWSPYVFGIEHPLSDAGAARLVLGVAAAFMFALALYESGVLLVRTEWADDPPSRSHLIATAVALILVGAVVLLPWSPFGPGIFVAGVITGLLVLLDLPRVSLAYIEPVPGTPLQAQPGGAVGAAKGSEGRAEAVLKIWRTRQHAPTRAEATTPEWIAIMPLVAVAAVSVTATVETALSNGWSDGNTWVTAFPILILVGLSILLTGVRPNDPRDINRFMRLGERWLPLTLGILVLTLIVFAFALWTPFDEWLLAVYGLLWFVVLSIYARWLFHGGQTPSPDLLFEPAKEGQEEDPRHREPLATQALGTSRRRGLRGKAGDLLRYLEAENKTAKPGWRGYPLRFGRYLERVVQTLRTSKAPLVVGPVAVGGGVAVFVAVQLRPLDSGTLLGVFTLVFVAFASALPLLHLAVRATLRLRPPRLLWWFGMNQVPVVTVLLLWWIAVGITQTQFDRTGSLHDARLVERHVEGDGSSPTLEAYFRNWLAAQDDLVDNGGDEPVPLVLVAAQGGGIRATYWTAVALDCIVGHSADGITKAMLDDATDAELAAFREHACTQKRRAKDERVAAAKRIFMASGVSGGAVGLYAYARQLLDQGDLGDREARDPDGWIERRLAHDFAAAALGWALFHDAPNRLFGLHPRVGGGCRFPIGNPCFDQDRAAVLEEAFDQPWKPDDDDPVEGSNTASPQLRRSFDLRFADDSAESDHARLVPLLAMNSTLTGGKARAVNSAADLGSWPLADARSAGTGDDTLPLAGAVEIRDALCTTLDMRLSTAALLTARFPYVTPSGRVPDNCAASGTPTGADRKAPCAHVRDDPGTRDPVTTCEGNYVDGGYTDNSGLATIISIWPSLRQLIVEHNTYAAESGLRKVAPLIIELDNHYQKSAQPDVASGGTAAETVVPPVTAFGGRSAIQTAARAAAYRILPTSCTVTISPALHPGLIAPLGWELSQAARKDLREGLTEPHPADTTGAALRNLLIVERRLSAERRQERALGDHPLADCLPPNPCRSPSDAPAPNDSPDVSPLENARLKKCRKSEQATEELAVQLNKP